MEASLLIRLIDRFSAPAEKVRGSLRGIVDTVGELKGGFTDAVRRGFSIENIEQATRNAEQKLGKARERMRGALAMGVALVAPLKSIGDFEARLVAFGNTAQIFGDDLKSIEVQLRQMGPAVNKSATEMLAALEYLVGKGMDPAVALASLRAVGMTSTATSAEISDMSASGYAAIDNLKVAAKDLQLAFDAMAQAGKAGGFELNSMAQYFPGLTAQASLLGMRGVPAVAELAAALQIARKATGDDATAANNMQNFLMKLSTPETRKRFAEIGVDVEKEFQVAADKGVSVFEHMLDLIQEKTGGNSARIADLFGDMQVINFLAPMMQNMDEYRRIRDEALQAQGVNEEDFNRVAETFNAQIKAIVIELGNLVAAGSPLLDIAKELASEFSALLRSVNAFAAANPELTRQIAYGIAALLAFNIAVRTLSYAFWSARLAAIGLSRIFLAFGASGQNVATGWRLLSSAGWVLRGALVAVQAVAMGIGSVLAGITAPAWGVIVALIAAGFALWKYWDRISSFISGFASVFGGLFTEAINGAIGLVDSLLSKIAEMLGIDPAAVEAFKAAIAAAFDFSGLIDGAKAILGEFWTWLGGFFSAEQLSGGEKAAMYAAGQAWAQSLVDGIQAHLEALYTEGQLLAQSLIDGIKAYLDMWIMPIRELFKFALEIEWPEPPAWLKWLVDQAGSAINGITGGAGAAPAPITAPSGGAFGQYLNGMDRLGAAGDELARGGEAGAAAIETGGQAAGAALQAGAQALRSAVGDMSAAISRASAAAARVGTAAPSAGSGKAAALHDGVD